MWPEKHHPWMVRTRDGLRCPKVGSGGGKAAFPALSLPCLSKVNTYLDTPLDTIPFINNAGLFCFAESCFRHGGPYLKFRSVGPEWRCQPLAAPRGAPCQQAGLLATCQLLSMHTTRGPGPAASQPVSAALVQPRAVHDTSMA